MGNLVGIQRRVRSLRKHNLAGDAGSIPGSGKKWQPTPVFLAGKSHGQRSLAGYCPRGCKRVGHCLLTKQQQNNRMSASEQDLTLHRIMSQTCQFKDLILLLKF